MLTRHPEWTAQQVKDALLGGVDPLPSLAGKTVTGGRLNVARAVNAGAAATAPIATTDTPTAVTSTTATLAATVDPAGADGALRFEYGPTPDLGTATAAQPVAGAVGATSLTQAIAGLAPGTTYYARAVLVGRRGRVRRRGRQLRDAARRRARRDRRGDAVGPYQRAPDGHVSPPAQPSATASSTARRPATGAAPRPAASRRPPAP